MKNADITGLLLNSRWSLQTTYSASPKLCIGLIASSLIASVVPASLAVIFGILVGVFKSAVDAEQPDFILIAQWFGAALLLILIGAICEIIKHYCSQRLNDELLLSVSNKILTHSAELDLAFFEDAQSQDVLFRATQNSGRDLLKFVLDTTNLISMLIQFCSLVAVMLWIEPLYTPLLIIFSFPWMFYQWRVANLNYKISQSNTTRRRWTRYYSSLLQDRLNIATTKLLNMAPLLLRRFQETMREIVTANKKFYSKQAAGSFVAATALSIILIVLTGLIGYKTLVGQNSIENFVTFWAAVFRFRDTLSRMVASLAGSLGSMLFVSNMLEFLSTKPLINKTDGENLASISGAITFEDVGFSYAGCDKQSLKQLSFSIKQGETVAFVGANGAGKTTAAKLIMRIYDASKGSIKIDQTDICTIPPEFLHKHIAYVGQSPAVFEASAHENIAFGDWEKLLEDKEAVKDIAQKAGIDEMISKMPEGYDTRLGRMFGGYDLSGGQWQQMAIARALAKDAEIYILDEPTSSLDVKTEHDIFERFKDLATGKTTILISHRFSSVNMVDRIFVFDDGGVVETGTHAELLSLNGVYSSLFKIHSRELVS